MNWTHSFYWTTNVIGRLATSTRAYQLLRWATVWPQ